LRSATATHSDTPAQQAIATTTSDPLLSVAKVSHITLDSAATSSTNELPSSSRASEQETPEDQRDLQTKVAYRHPLGTDPAVRLAAAKELYGLAVDLDEAPGPSEVLYSQSVLDQFFFKRSTFIVSMLKTLDERIAKIARLMEHLAPSLPTRSVAQLTTPNDIYRKLAHMKNFPAFTTGDVFWRDLERHATANGITTDADRQVHFHSALSIADPTLKTWFETSIQPLMPISMEQLQDLLFKQTLSPYWLSDKLIMLCRLSYREQELVKVFNSRFAELPSQPGSMLTAPIPLANGLSLYTLHSYLLPCALNCHQRKYLKTNPCLNS
jgi:hypothetical protein